MTEKMPRKYQLNPDFRRDAPRDKPYCVRCQKAVDPNKARHVTVDWNTWEVTDGGDELIGPDCWKAITLAE